MSDKKTMPMEKAMVIAIAALVVGFIMGMLAYHMVVGAPEQPVMATQPPGISMTPPSMTPPGSNLPNFSQQIKELENLLAANPDNTGAWVTLGNLHFDSERFAESVAAYSKAIELGVEDPNVLTDRGVMYRRLGDFSAALADFDKAHAIDPSHYQALYNIGLVQLHDLGNNKEALVAWEKMLLLNIDPQLKAQMQTRVDALKQMGDTTMPKQ